MKRKEIYVGKVEKIEFPNVGIVSVDGEEKKVAVKNALPGEVIKFRLTKNRKDIACGQFLEILKKSPYSINEECPYFRQCGGCLYQGFSYEKQLEIKEKQVRIILSEYVSDKKWEGIIKSPSEFNYRNKMEFSFGDLYKGGPLSLGMHKRCAHYDIVNVSGCKLMTDDFSAILDSTLNFFKDLNISFYHTNTHEGYLRHLLIREGKKTGEILVDLVTTTNIEENFEEKILENWKENLLKLKLDGNIVSILHTKNDSFADIVKDEGTSVLYGENYFKEKLFNLDFKVTPFSFFQTNTFGAEKLYAKVREYVGDIKGKVVYDLYCGTGTITQIMASVSKIAYGVEIVSEAVLAAKENAKLNSIENAEFICGDVLKVLDDLSEDDKENSITKKYQKPDVIILDPPREGINPKALEKIINYNVKEIVYVSCKPTSLGRDLKLFVEKGYSVKKACAVDMFPWTGNVETVALMSRNEDSQNFNYFL